MNNTDEQEATPKTPDALTIEFLASALAKEYGEPNIELESFRVKDADAGVLSHVVIIDVEYKKCATTIAKKFVAKFLQPQFPLEHMFVVESRFYRELGAKKTFSFQTPRPVYTSNTMIMVEHVASETSYSAVDGCPKDLVLPMITKLGEFHAKYLHLTTEQLDKTCCKGLAFPAGVGSTLGGLAKETQFPGQWEDFLQKIPSVPDAVRLQVKEICQQLSSRRLSNIHETMHDDASPYQTLIHGDFHVANMLLQRDHQTFLVDWATCGRGNPLIDLAFFAIVSVTSSVRKGVEEDMLQAYHQALSSSCSSNVSLAEVKKLYRLCVLNQFLILVCYDKLSRQLSAQAKRPDELTHHFDVVNARACHALADNFGEDLLPRQKTKEEAAMKPQGDATL